MGNVTMGTYFQQTSQYSGTHTLSSHLYTQLNTTCNNHSAYTNKTLSHDKATDWPSLSLLTASVNCLLSHISFVRQYFLSKQPANRFAPTLGLLRASEIVFQLGLSLVVNQVLSTSRSLSVTLGISSLILSIVSTPKWRFSPSPFHWSHTSISFSSRSPRSSNVSLFPGRSGVK